MLRRGENRWFVTALALLALLSLGAAVPSFWDLRGHWSQAAVTALAARGFIEGFPDGSYRPDQMVTRAQVAKLVSLVLGQQQAAEPAALVSSRFRDMSGHWARGHAEVLAELNVMRGYPGGLFRPEQPVSRLELVILAARAAGLEPAAGGAAPGFPDDDRIPAWAAAEVAAAVAAGLIQEIYPTAQPLEPARMATRGEAGGLLARALAHRGLLYHAAGVVQSWKPEDGEVQILTPAGQIQTLRTTVETIYFHNGLPGQSLQPLDQLWALLDARGQAVFVSTRYVTLMGHTPKVAGDRIRMFGPNYQPLEFRVLPTAQLFLNGRPAQLAELAKARRIYAVMDERFGGARIVDGVQYTHYGAFVRYISAERRLLLQEPSGRLSAIRVSRQALVYVGGRRSELSNVAAGTNLMVHVPAGEAVFIQTDE